MVKWLGIMIKITFKIPPTLNSTINNAKVAPTIKPLYTKNKTFRKHKNGLMFASSIISKIASTLNTLAKNTPKTEISRARKLAKTESGMLSIEASGAIVKPVIRPIIKPISTNIDSHIYHHLYSTKCSLNSHRAVDKFR